MKYFTLLLVLIALTTSAVALKNEVCGLPHSADGTPDGVFCRALFYLYTYKQDTNECDVFMYGGCGGNANRFHSKEECEKTCVE